ncbi:asr2172 [Nostoc sp. PCC 7120 = FACHB-418]|nr:asr2172 [Nostoc sp. PCC 7120 = FACHB-418]
MIYKNNTMSSNLLQRITYNPEICHGKPCIRGLRYPVELILELLSAGMTPDEILADYDDLEREDIFAALQFAVRLSQVKSIHKIAS